MLGWRVPGADADCSQLTIRFDEADPAAAPPAEPPPFELADDLTWAEWFEGLPRGPLTSAECRSYPWPGRIRTLA